MPTTYQATWAGWTTTAGTGTSTGSLDYSGSGTWQAWTTASSTTTTLTIGGSRPTAWSTPTPRLTSEELRLQRERRDERDEEIRLNRQVLQEQAAIANQRAAQLLVVVLSAAERAEYDDTGALNITGSNGGHYRIDDGYQGNVIQLDEAGQDYQTLCCHPKMTTAEGGRLPNTDAWIAQILALKTDEPAFLQLANAALVRGHQRAA